MLLVGIDALTYWHHQPTIQSLSASLLFGLFIFSFIYIDAKCTKKRSQYTSSIQTELIQGVGRDM